MSSLHFNDSVLVSVRYPSCCRSCFQIVTLQWVACQTTSLPVTYNITVIGIKYITRDVLYRICLYEFVCNYDELSIKRVTALFLITELQHLHWGHILQNFGELHQTQNQMGEFSSVFWELLGSPHICIFLFPPSLSECLCPPRTPQVLPPAARRPCFTVGCYNNSVPS